jgi:hypothetical protein
MKTTPAARQLLAILPMILLTGCESRPAWGNQVRQIKPGMTRTEAEALLPTNAVSVTSFGSSGMHRQFYLVGKD